MNVTKMIDELEKVLRYYGDVKVFLHDTADGSDYVVPTIYVDEECEEDGIHYPSECIIEFDSKINIIDKENEL